MQSDCESLAFYEEEDIPTPSAEPRGPTPIGKPLIVGTGTRPPLPKVSLVHEGVPASAGASITPVKQQRTTSLHPGNFTSDDSIQFMIDTPTAVDGSVTAPHNRHRKPSDSVVSNHSIPFYLVTDDDRQSPTPLHAARANPAVSATGQPTADNDSIVFQMDHATTGGTHHQAGNAVQDLEVDRTSPRHLVDNSSIVFQLEESLPQTHKVSASPSPAGASYGSTQLEFEEINGEEYTLKSAAGSGSLAFQTLPTFSYERETPDGNPKKTVVSNRLKNASNGSTPEKGVASRGSGRRRHRRTSRTAELMSAPSITNQTPLVAGALKEDGLSRKKSAGGTPAAIGMPTKAATVLQRPPDFDSLRKPASLEEDCDCASPINLAETMRQSASCPPSTSDGTTALHSTSPSQPRFRSPSSQTRVYTDTGCLQGATDVTEAWRAYKKQQQQELHDLKRRIEMARQQDRTVLEGVQAAATPAPRVFHPSSSCAVGYRRTQKGGSYSSQLDSKKPTLQLTAPQPTPMTTAARGTTPPHPRTGTNAGSRLPNHKYSEQTAPPATVSVQRQQPLALDGRHSSLRTPSLPKSSHCRADVGSGADHSIPSPAAEEAVARLLGVVWPPTSPEALFFVTGARLTAAQVNSFYDTVVAQKAISPSAAGTNGVVSLRRCSPERTPCPASSRGQQADAKKTKKRVSRSAVLREVFDLLDWNRRGCLHSPEIPVLQHLLTAELHTLEQRLQCGGGMPQRNMALLEAAVAQRQRYEKAWSSLLCRAKLGGSMPHKPLPGFEKENIPIDMLKTQRRAVLCSFALNVVLPLLGACHIDTLDFATSSMLILGAIQKGGIPLTASPEDQAWREVVHVYFDVLS